MPSIDLMTKFTLGLLESFLEQHRVPFDAVLVEAGLEHERFDEPFAMVSASTIARVLDTAARLARLPDLGIAYGEYFALRAAAIVGQMQLTAPNVRELLASTVEFAPLGLPAMRLELVEEHDVATLTGYLATIRDADPRHLAEFMLAVLVTRIRRGAGQRWTPLAVDLCYRAPDDTRALRLLAGEKIRFEQPAYRVEIARETMDIAFPDVPLGPYAMTRDYLRRLLERAPYLDETVAGATERAITQRLAEDQPTTLDAVAEAVGRTPRSLQLRLEQEGCTFEAVLVRTRVELARRYLRDSDLPMSEVAARLGFKSPSALSRWVNQNLGTTPTEARKRLRRERVSSAATAMRRLAVTPDKSSPPKR